MNRLSNVSITKNRTVSLLWIQFLISTKKKRNCTENSCLCKSPPTHCHPQVHSVPRSEARFRCCQGIHVQSQPKTEPAEEHRYWCYRCGSPEYHQRRHWFLSVYGQLQWEVKMHNFQKGRRLIISNWDTERNGIISHRRLCAVQIKALAKIHAFVVDPWVTLLVSTHLSLIQHSCLSGMVSMSGTNCVTPLWCL